MDETASDKAEARTEALSVGAAAFAVLQSVCALVVGLAGVQTLIGITALSTAVLHYAVALHTDLVRIPMLVFSLLAAAFVLYTVHRRRSLRSRAAADWRRRPLTKKTIIQERVQASLAIVTLALVALELVLHNHFHHHI